MNWGTIVPGAPSGPILPFRRNGELMTNVDKPEYILYTRRMTNIDTPSYCVDCLEYMWSKRGETRDTIRKLHDSMLRPQYRLSEDSSVPRPVLDRRHSGSKSTDAASLAVRETSSMTATRNDAVMDGPLDKVGCGE